METDADLERMWQRDSRETMGINEPGQDFDEEELIDAWSVL